MIAIPNMDKPKEERNKGHWINDTNYSGWTCTNCGYHDGCAVYNFCPNCGARMKGADDESNTERD